MDSLPVLPRELLYRVINAIDAVSPEGRRSLISCSYTDRALSVICQERIFRNVQISYVTWITQGNDKMLLDYEGTTGHKFRDLLAGSPHIGPYVQNLTITLSSIQRFNAATLAKYSKTSSETALFSLYAIVPQLRNLKGLIAPNTINSIIWSSVEEHAKAFFTSIIPTLTKLDLYYFTLLPLSVFYGCDNLEELHVSSLYMDTTQPSQSAIRKVKLRVLQAANLGGRYKPDSQWFTMRNSPFDISRLRSLKLSETSPWLSEINEMLAPCSHTLEELDFHLPPYLGGDPLASTGQTPSLGLLYNLRHLTIRVRMFDHSIQSQSIEKSNYDLFYMAKTLKSLPFVAFRPKQLELTVGMISYLSDSENSLPLLPWFHLIGILEDDQLSPFFADVKLSIPALWTGHGSERQVMSPTALTRILDRNEGLKKLREKGILSYGFH